MYKLSFCTVCMNRLHHIRETLPVNIAESRNCPEVDFVLLDYNSADGLADWVHSEMKPYLDSGVLKYFRTTDPQYFDMSHSKNMVSNLSRGDIICMIDSDNYTGVNFAAWVQSVFAGQGKDTVITVFNGSDLAHGDIGGKIACHRDYFNEVRGYDETMAGYGMDDMDLVNRLVKTGCKKVIIEEEGHKQFISHSLMERLKHYNYTTNLASLYIRVTATMRTKPTVLYLADDGSFYQVAYDFVKPLEYERAHLWNWHIEEDNYQRGTYERDASGYVLTRQAPVRYEQLKENHLVSTGGGEKEVWRRIDSNDSLYYSLLIAYHKCMNQVKYYENKKFSRYVNPSGWGKGTVYHNFDQSKPLNALRPA